MRPGVVARSQGNIFDLQLPAGAVPRPVRDIGPPKRARFSGVSGTAPLVTVWVVTVAGATVDAGAE